MPVERSRRGARRGRAWRSERGWESAPRPKGSASVVAHALDALLEAPEQTLDALEAHLHEQCVAEPGTSHLLVEPGHEDAHEAHRAEHKSAHRHAAEMVAQHARDRRAERREALIDDPIAIDVAVAVGIVLGLHKVPVADGGGDRRVHDRLDETQ